MGVTASPLGGAVAEAALSHAHELPRNPRGSGRGLARVRRALLADPPERALMRAAQEGDSGALEQIFRRHWHDAHRAAYLVVHDAAAAEDIAQEAFLAAIRALDRFDRRRPFGPWLHRIVVNRAIDYSRARALRREVEQGEHPGGEEGAKPPSDEVMTALAGLAPENRAVVVLRYLLGYTPGDIARLLELPRGTVNSRLRRGLDRLAVALEEEQR